MHLRIDCLVLIATLPCVCLAQVAHLPCKLAQTGVASSAIFISTALTIGCCYRRLPPSRPDQARPVWPYIRSKSEDKPPNHGHIYCDIAALAKRDGRGEGVKYRSIRRVRYWNNSCRISYESQLRSKHTERARLYRSPRLTLLLCARFYPFATLNTHPSPSLVSTWAVSLRIASSAAVTWDVPARATQQ